ncbi:MAG: lytic murein transglycosylase [Paracoccaceae bacterium]
MQYSLQDDESFKNWISAFRPKALGAGIDADLYDCAMLGRELQVIALEKDRDQPEFTNRIWDYLDRAVSESCIKNGQKMLALHGALFAILEDDFGVSAKIIAAIWGIESAYGSYRGNFLTLDCLATLAFDARRGAFFEAELIAALRILAAGDSAPNDLRGSWAGAMGHGQFMPSSYLENAVDYDQNGKRDIWSDDPTDALASIAAYLQKAGWKKGAPWGAEMWLSLDFEWALYDMETRRPVQNWLARGLTPLHHNLPLDMPAHLYLPAGHQGPAFLLCDNFAVIKSYNASDAYALAVAHLADRLKGGPAITKIWPRHARALSRPEVAELQRLLNQAGFDTKGADGKIGPNTLVALQKYQFSRGWPRDGFVTIGVLEGLRG